MATAALVVHRAASATAIIAPGRAVAATAAAGISLWWLMQHRLARFSLPGAVGEAITLFALGGALGFSPPVVALLYAGLALRALCGGTGTFLAAAAAYAGAHLGGVALVLWPRIPSASIAAAGAGLAVAGGLHAAQRLLEVSRAVADPAWSLRRADPALAGAADAESILRAVREAAAAVLGPRALTVAAVGRVVEEELVFDVGTDDRAVRVRLGRGEALARTLRSGMPAELRGGAARSVVARVGLSRKVRRAFVVPLATRGQWGAAIVVFSRSRLSARLRHVLEMLGSRAELALERAAVTDALHESERRFRALVQNSSDVILVVRPDATVQYLTPSVERVLGYRPEELTDLRLLDLLHPDDVPAALTFFSQTADQLGEASIIEWRMRHRDGTWVHMETAAHNLLHEPNIGGFVLSTRDVSQRKLLEEQLIHQALHDPVTGLANRALFGDRIQHALARARRSGRGVAAVMLDLDDFKTVNDGLGHAAGDRLLVAVGERLAGCLRSGDTLARLGGDEFGILLEDISTREDAAEVAERVVAALRDPVAVEGREVFVRASVGVALGEAPESPESLLRNADAAMNMAKSYRRGGVEFFEPFMHQAVVERLELRGDLERAIRAGELRVHYQPIVELGTGEPVGVEALVRWEHPRRGVLGPDEFVPLAEEAGLISAVDRWVLEQACHKGLGWGRRLRRSLRVSVNVSARQLQRPGLVAEVAETVRRSGVDPQDVVLEISESVLMRDTETTAARLRELKALGVRVAVDDFGTGYSSLSYLRRFPVDILKIDRLFVDGLGAREEDAAVVQAILELGRALRLETVAEGIESGEQVELLGRLGCRLGQGYLFSAPLPEGEVEEYLGGHRSATPPHPRPDGPRAVPAAYGVR